MAEPHPLRRKRRPDFESGERTLALVDLFSGCGGLTLGVAQAAHAADIALDVRLAVDCAPAPLRIYQSNFPPAKTRLAAIEDLFDGELGSRPTTHERTLKSSVGTVDLLVGGPPCQGHSNLNNHTRRSDPKNALYLRMVRAAEVLRPRAVLIENVPAVVHDENDVVGTAKAALVRAGFGVGAQTLELVEFGVAQLRKRHVLLAVREETLNDAWVLALVQSVPGRRRSLRWAIGDLLNTDSKSFMDAPSRPHADNMARMRYLLATGEYDLPNSLRPKCHQGDHSYVSMYGRLRWTEPAQTITSGYGSIGQGRYMHPEEPRTLTPHEAARIQGFPDYFKFDAALTRTELATIIGNAVPPPLAEAVVQCLLSEGILG